jgi:hypothetical protein
MSVCILGNAHCLEEVALEAIDRIYRACLMLQNPEYGDVFGSARSAIYVAQIGVYALSLNVERVLQRAVDRYSELRQAFRQQDPRVRFVGDFESAEQDMLDRGQNGPMFDPEEREFFSTVTREQISIFFGMLK